MENNFLKTKQKSFYLIDFLKIAPTMHWEIKKMKKYSILFYFIKYLFPFFTAKKNLTNIHINIIIFFFQDLFKDQVLGAYSSFWKKINK